MIGNSLDAFEKIVRELSPDLKVLDVGAAGLEGENTTNYLLSRFKDVTLINRRDLPFPGIIKDDFYTHEFKEKYDLIVLDLNIDNNIKEDWTEHGFKRLSNLLNDDGYVIIYVMTTTDYGDPETPEMILIHMREWWGADNIDESVVSKKKIEGFEIVTVMRENRRPEILWTLLKKK